MFLIYFNMYDKPFKLVTDQIWNNIYASGFFFGTLGLGPGPLELGKLATKLEFWEISHFNKPFRLEVCLRYLNNYNNKWMPVLSIGEIKYTITYFFTKFWIGKFFRQFWEYLEENRIATGAEFRTQIGSKKTHCQSNNIWLYTRIIILLVLKSIWMGKRYT